MAKKASKKSGRVATIDGEERDYTTGVEWKTPIKHQPYGDVGNLTPAKMRAMNIKRENMAQQVEWAEEWLIAVEETEDGRKRIEQIRSQVQKKYFATEKAVDEYVLASLLADEGYQAHFREWTARKDLELGLIKHVEAEEIRAVADEFTQKTLEWKTRTDIRIQRFQAESQARIADMNTDKDNSQAQQRIAAKKRLKAFTSGAPMDEVNAIGVASKAVVTVSASGGRSKSLLDVFSFNW